MRKWPQGLPRCSLGDGAIVVVVAVAPEKENTHTQRERERERIEEKREIKYKGMAP